MSDDMWEPDKPGDPKKREFGDDWDQLDRIPTDQAPVKPAPPRIDPSSDHLGGFDDFSDGLPPLKFGDDDTGLPHWNDPPTGEIPSLFAEPDASADLDVWSSFSSAAPGSAGQPSGPPSGGIVTPQWADDGTLVDATGFAAVPPARGPSGTGSLVDPFGDDTGIVTPPRAAAPRSPIQIGTDPTSDGSAPIPRDRSRGERSAGSEKARTTPRPGPNGPVKQSAGGFGGRNMGAAIGVGLGLAALFIGLLRYNPIAVLGMIVAVLGLAAVEFYDKTAERGYRPVSLVGIGACALAPLAAYWRGTDGLLLAIVAALIAAMVSAMTYDGVESGPLPNTAVTMLGVGWIGLLGSFGALILKFGEDNKALAANIGTDTLFYMAVGVVATDVGALVIGSFLGRTPLRKWISPNKTVEGLIGGVIMTVLAMLAVNALNDKATVWNNPKEVIVLAIVIAIMAPIGDLAESMFKRNLDIKDFGTLIPGHGGVLDRFDGFLFALPSAYYLLTAMEPYLTAK